MVIFEVFSHINGSLLLFFWESQLLMGFCVVCRVFEEESSSCHCHGKGGEAREPYRVTPSCIVEQMPDQFGYYNQVLLGFMQKGMLLPFPVPGEELYFP